MSEKQLEQQAITSSFMNHLNSAEEVRNWVLTYLDIDLPIGTLDPDSNSSPAEAIWEVYSNYKNNQGDVTPGYIWLSARDCYKCVKKGTNVLKKDGFLTPIEDVKIDDVIWSGKGWRKVTNWIDDGVKESVTVILKNGAQLTGSPIHRVWAANKSFGNTTPGWVRMSEVAIGDLIAVNTPEDPYLVKIVVSEYESGLGLGLSVSQSQEQIDLANVKATRSTFLGFVNGLLRPYKSGPCTFDFPSSEFIDGVIRTTQAGLAAMGIDSSVEFINKRSSLTVSAFGIRMLMQLRPGYDERYRLDMVKFPYSITNNYHKVVSVNTGTAHFYDLTVEEDHSYWSDGFISHNTLSESILNVLLMTHFGATIAHLAAIESQAAKAVEYVSSFIKKIQPYLLAHGKSVDSENKRTISVLDKENNRAFVVVIIASVQGANSQHCNVLSIDEVDVMRFPKAYEEAKFIPGYAKGQNPITVKTSTRKFAFGLMEKEIQNIDQSGDKLLRWNLMDVTERCPKSRHQPDKPKVERYIHPRLPLKNISPADMASLPESKRKEFQKITAHAGCATCPLLPVCKTRLASRPEGDHGGLYKPITFAINQFKKMEPDMAEAQIMCWKPSQSGLVYSRYEDVLETGNLKSVGKAWEQFTGTPPPPGLTLKMLTDYMLTKGIQFEVGGDWGFRHAFALVVSAQVLGEWWLIDSVSIPGLDPDQQIKVATEVKERYKIRRKWIMDTSQPGMMVMFKKNGMPCKEFKKDVQLGIALTKTQVIDAGGKRRLFVIDHEANQWLRQGFCKHHYKLDSAGDPTNDPDDDEYADVMDVVRYKAQVLFNKGKKPTIVMSNAQHAATQNPFGAHLEQGQMHYESWMMQQARLLATEDQSSETGSNQSKTIFWTFGDGKSS